MKILQVFDYFSPYGGGTVDAIYKLSRALAQNGHKITIYTSDFKLDQAYIDSLTKVKFTLFHNVSSFLGFYVMPEIIKKAKVDIKNYDVIHLQCARSFQNIILHHYAMKYNVPYIMDTHGSLPRTYAGKRFDYKCIFKWLYDVFFGYRILRDAKRVIAESQVGIKEYQRYGVKTERITKIPSPIDTTEFMYLPPHGLFKKELNSINKDLIVFLGRISWIKGLDFLVNAFSDLVKLRSNIVCVIAGNDDGYQQKITEAIQRLSLEDKVIFTGFLSGQNKLKALVDASVVVQPSIYEQGVRVAFEAIMCDTPVIVTKNTGPGEIINSIDGGYVVDYGNNSQLRDIMNHVLVNREEALQKTKRAKEYIIKNLSVKSGAKKFEELYREVTGKHHDL